MELVTATNIYFERHNEGFIPMEETIKRCAKAGFKKLDFGFAELVLVSETFASEEWREELKNYKEMVIEAGMEIVQAHATVFDFCNAIENYEVQEKLFRRSLEGAAYLGASWVVVHPSTHLVDGYRSEKNYEKNVDFFRKYAQFANELGIGIAIENMWGRTENGEKPYGLEAIELYDLIEGVGYDNIRICWDVEHGSVEKLDQRAAINLLKDYIVTTHVSDETGPGNIHVLPYLGTADWNSILSAFAEIQYNGVLDLEIQHYLPGVPEPLVDDAMKLAYKVGIHLIEELERLKMVER